MRPIYLPAHSCHSREGGNRLFVNTMDSRLRGNDELLVTSHIME
jgi:hypothetical protein